MLQLYTMNRYWTVFKINLHEKQRFRPIDPNSSLNSNERKAQCTELFR